MGENNEKFTPQKILIATDGSEASERAADFGIDTLKFEGAKVYAVYVIDTGSYGSVPVDKKKFKKIEQLEETGHKATSYVEKKAKAAGMEVESVVLQGNPAEEIVDFAEEERVDMIVVGSLGKSGIKRFMLGSVSEKVVRRAKIPVLVVRGQKEEKPYKQILIAADCSKGTEKAVDFGIEIAKLNGAKVYAVHVIDPVFNDLMEEAWAEEAYKQFKKIGREAVSHVEEKAKAAGVKVESVVLEGNPAEEIVDFAEEQKVDMIVVGSLGKSGYEQFAIGSVSAKVLRNAKVPVLIVHDIYEFVELFRRCQKSEEVLTPVAGEKEQ
ncbi:universal stress protein [Methanosarcina sp.]|mgnify:CR=1 FL=1|uniref:universal stress protein n=1 Tax=Methanosarcina sp. TaxID=2213 RepID=UPI002B78DC3F|nr:universal stress protein [Methanosarcina sp.]HOW15696.1 universal stress protein [Methanosarcina sp.]